MKRTLPFLIAMVVLSVIETDLYLASFPAIARTFQITEGFVQSSLNIYLFCFAVGLLFVGPLSDRYGRKRVFISALALDLMGTMISMCSNTPVYFLIGRAAQAFGGCAGTVLGRVIARELYSGTNVRLVLAYLFTGVSVGIALIPVTGGIIEELFGWRYNFLFLAVFQLILLTGVWRLLPETLKESMQDTSIRLIFHQFRQVIARKEFRYYGSLITLAWSGFFVLVGGASFFLTKHFGISPSQFGFLFALMICGMIAGTVIAGKFLHLLPINKAILIAILLIGIGGLMSAFSFLLSLPFFCASLFIYLLGVGFLMPLCQEGATEGGGNLLSSMFSLLYFSKMMGASLTGFVFSLFNRAELLPWFITGFAFFCIFIYLRMNRIKLWVST